MRIFAAITFAAALALQALPARADPQPASEERVLVVRPGDTLARMLDSAGIDDAAAATAIASLATLFRPTSLRPGDDVALRLTTSDPAILLEIEVEPEPGRTIRTRRAANGTWRAEQLIAPASALPHAPRARSMAACSRP